MPEEVITVVEEEENTLFVHKFGKWAVCGFAGLLASTLAEKAYDAILTAYRANKASSGI
jgi:hypothetical protein